MADLVGRNIPLIFIVCGALTAAIALLLATNRSYRAIMSTDFGRLGARRGPAPQPEIPAAK